MAARLTDKQKKEIIADYIQLGSYNAVAKLHGVSKDTVKRVVQSCEDFAQKAQQKKEENTADILAVMEGKKQDVCAIISLYLEYLQDLNKLDRASIQSIATSLGIIIDKFTQGADRKPETEMFENIVRAAGGKFETN